MQSPVLTRGLHPCPRGSCGVAFDKGHFQGTEALGGRCPRGASQRGLSWWGWGAWRGAARRGKDRNAESQDCGQMSSQRCAELTVSWTERSTRGRARRTWLRNRRTLGPCGQRGLSLCCGRAGSVMFKPRLRPGTEQRRPPCVQQAAGGDGGAYSSNGPIGASGEMVPL